MKKLAVLSTIAVLALALLLVPTAGKSAEKHKTGMGMMDCPRMMGSGMMHGMGMGPGMGMMMGMGSGGQKLSDADRGDLLVLQGQILLKKAELLTKQAEAMITEGESLQGKAEKTEKK
jgi:hypothetical protein